MKKLLTLVFLMAVCGFSACEQVNPLANAGTNVQVTEGDPAAGDEDNDNDDDDNDNDGN